MSQLSSMFAAGDIIQTILGTFFLGHPVSKLGCLQETRAQYFHFLSSYSNFKFWKEKQLFFLENIFSVRKFQQAVAELSQTLVKL